MWEYAARFLLSKFLGLSHDEITGQPLEVLPTDVPQIQMPALVFALVSALMLDF